MAQVPSAPHRRLSLALPRIASRPCPAGRRGIIAVLARKSITPQSSCTEDLNSDSEQIGHSFAAISASTYFPPPSVGDRQIPVHWISAGVFGFLLTTTVFMIYKAEKRSRNLLGRVGETPDSPMAPLPPEAEERFARYMAAITQNRLVENAMAALNKQDLMRFIVEVEQALEENRLSRESIELDLYEEHEVTEVYRAALKVWLDGYPLDYGKLLQLRVLLRIPNNDAEALEEEIRNVSDAFVI